MSQWLVATSLALLLSISSEAQNKALIEHQVSRTQNAMAQLNQAFLAAEATIFQDSRNSDSPAMCQGRLTLQAGTPIPTSDLSNQSTLYFTPYHGSRISLHTGTQWRIYPFTEISLALSGLTANTNYDVFVYDNAGVLTIALTAWADDTTRATALSIQDGIYVLSSNSTRRYVGTIRTTSTSQTQDTQTQRFVWNLNHRVRRPFSRSETTNSWTYSTAAFRVLRGSATNIVEYVSGLDETSTAFKGLVLATGGGTNSTDISIAFGLNTASEPITNSPRGGSARNTIRQQLWGQAIDLDNGAGYVRIYWIEYGNTNGITFYGDDGGDARIQAGLLGWVYG